MPPTDGPPTPGAGLHANVLDALGQEIVSGTTPVGAVVRIDQLDERFGVSRSVVREAVRVLSSMGLVETRRRLGVRVRPRTQWNVFDPRVIRWRLDGPDREDQLLSLGELRRGFEPVAAELAADRATPDQCGAMAAAEAMTAIITEASEAVRRTAAAPEGTAAD
jgi:DNA-binding FadR family transcriptional regulator